MCGVRGSAIIVLVVCMFVLTGETVSAAETESKPKAPGRPIEQIVPGDTLFVLSFPDLGASAKDAKETALYKIWSDPGVQEYLAPLRAKISELHIMAEAMTASQTGPTIADFEKLLDGQLHPQRSGVAAQGPVELVQRQPRAAWPGSQAEQVQIGSLEHQNLHGGKLVRSTGRL